MNTDASLEILWPRLAEFIAAHTGLHFPSERRADLMRGFESAAREMDFQEPAHYAQWLLSETPTQHHLCALAGHLTIGETYFFREESTLEALSKEILPQLIASRRGQRQHLRLWSAACSTGEEAYSLAIMLDLLLPDQRDWRISILATDINGRALERAAAGVYGEWSFRTFPEELRERYFTRIGEKRFAIRPEIRQRVTFAHLNLAADDYSAHAGDTRQMDVILCRNLLIYFTPDQARKLAAKLHDSLADGGWLAVSPSECSQALFSNFTVVNFPGAILYHKSTAEERAEALVAPLATVRPDVLRAVVPARSLPISTAPVVTRAVARPAAPVVPRISGNDSANPPPRPEDTTRSQGTFSTLARKLANEGRLEDALAWSEQWVAADKVNAAAHYLHATVLQEMGDCEAARSALHRCLYLQPDFALAHFGLGNLERSESNHAEARKHFENAQRLLHALPAVEVLPEAEGLTVGRLSAIVSTLLSLPTPSQSVPAPITERSHDSRGR